MARIFFAKGVSGEIVRSVQSQLGFTGGDLDGVYGGDTFKAVTKFQKNNGLAQTGALDADTWQPLMQRPIPDVEQRALQLTGTFEGHGFRLAQGNFDGAGITWGIIGFTLQGGELGALIQDMNQKHPELVSQAFGSKTDQLLELLNQPFKKQLIFADSISLGASKERLAEPWRSAFNTFGGIPEVQEAQLTRSNKNYFKPALVAANKLGFTTELGIALLFDIHVQNGGISARAKEKIDAFLADHPVASEQDVRILVANAVADSARPQFRQDVLDRKLTIATGTGKVHGSMFMLSNWGLDEFPAST